MRTSFAALALAGPVGWMLGQSSLPMPTGSFPVGRLMLSWSDPNRLEDVGPTSGKPREVVAYVFYPATAAGNRVQYFPGLPGLESAPEARYLRQQFGDLWKSVVSGTISTNSYDAPPMPMGKMRFPVLIFSPGLLAPVLAYQLQLEELASHGYVVFGLEHGTDSTLIIRPDRTLLPYVSRRPPDQGPPTVAGLEENRDQVARRSSDVVFALDQVTLLNEHAGSVFRGRLDLSRVGAFGHSQGGKAAIRSCQADSRLRACLNQDGEMFGIPFGSTDPIPSVLPGKKIRAPVAVIYVAEPGIPDAQLASVNVTRRQYEDWRTAKNHALRTFLQDSTQDSRLVTITTPGFVHGTFMDIGLLTPGHSPQSVINHRTGTVITRQFFDANLRFSNQRAWSRFVSQPGEGIKVEQLGRRFGR